ncbi:GPO family capsid scaffolding protein [Sodalis sp.]|uniref:GPO family capsid scaffolding protein n=1 Tax=Sodalis sp. (in: enterobacteria) TaxID=1898979 RepID=UPI0038732B34
MSTKNTQTIRLTVCTEGMTLNGFAVSRAHIEQMAANYSPQLYPARLNLEHIKSLLPNSTFRHFGLVQALTAHELKDGPLKGKLALDAEIVLDTEQDADLIALNRSGQKLFSSIEYYDKFPATQGAYLSGIALTDTPAVAGTQLICLSARERGLPDDESPRFYTASLETTLTYVQQSQQDNAHDRQEGARFLSTIRELLTGNRHHDRNALKQLREAIELTASTCRDTVEQVQALSSTTAQLATELSTLKQQLATQDPNLSYRPLADGSGDTLAQY